MLKATLVMALVTAGWSCASPFAGASSQDRGQVAGTVWICRPGLVGNPCASSLAATGFHCDRNRGAGQLASLGAGVEVPLLLRPLNRQPRQDGEHRLAGHEVGRGHGSRAGRLSTACNVWAPAYRSETWPTGEKFLAGDESVMRSTFAVAYESVLAAWNWFFARGVGAAPLMLPAGRAGRLGPLMLPAGRAGRLGPLPRPKLQEKAQGDR